MTTKRVALSALLLLSACFFKKETASDNSGVRVGGTIMLDKCGYSVTTPMGVTPPVFGTPKLGKDPTPKFVHLNLAGDPSTTMTVLWRTNDEETLASVVEYGVNGKLDTRELGLTFAYDGPTRMHETHLCGLMPDTEYSYRVGGVDENGTEAWSQSFTFRTAPPAGADQEMVVLVIGDTRDSYTLWGQSVALAYQKATPDLILFSGDATTLGPLQDEWDAWFTAADPYLAGTPMVFAHGNHEQNSENFFAQFAMPADEENFAFDYGPIHLTVANDSPADPADLTGRNAQTLDTNLKAGVNAPWNVLMHHKPMFSASAGPHPQDVVLVRSAWQSIVDAAKVDIVFNGHDHDYERSKPMRGTTPGNTPADGTIYVVVGSAGAVLYDNGSNFWTQMSEKTHSFAIVRARKGSLTMNAYRDDGSALDTVAITK